ncbi:MAG: nitroreductase family protein [Actinomycetales bacterium]
MDLADVVHRRRMVRAYDPDRPVPRETLGRLLALAVHAPSAGFSQGWDFVVLSRPEEVAAFWAATTGGSEEPPDSWLRGMQTAPALVLCLSHRDAYLDRYAEPDKGWTDRDEARGPIPSCHTDTARAGLLMLLGAVDEGLGACFFGVPGERWNAVRSTFGVPDSRDPVGVISVGYPAPDRRSPSLRRGRRGVEQVGHDGRFGQPWLG